MKLKKLFSAATLAGLFLSTSAMATPFTIDTNSFNPTAPGDGITALIKQLGVNFVATSTFTDDNGIAGLNVGDSVVDVGSGSVGSYLGLAGEVLGGAGNRGLNFLYSLDFSYSNLMGTVAFDDGMGGIVASYTSGDISIFTNEDPLNEILRLGITGSAGGVGNLLLFAKVTAVDPDIFFFNGVTDFAGLDVVIDTRIDSNLDPVVPVASGTNEAGQTLFTRTATLDGSVAFDVPEPGILALLGLGLMGIGYSRRSRKTA